MDKKAIAVTRLKHGVPVMWFPMLALSLVLGAGCVASKSELRDMQSDLQNNAGTARKELKAEIDAAKKQTQDETQQAVQKLKAEIDGKAIKALSEQKEKIDAMSTEMKTQDESLTKEVQLLKQQNQQLAETVGRTMAGLKTVQDQLTEVQKTNLQVLREFQALRTGVQVTYGGVLDYLKVEEALLKSSLQRVQTILHGVHQTEADALPALIDPKRGPAPAAPPSAPAPAEKTPPPKAAP